MVNAYQRVCDHQQYLGLTGVPRTLGFTGTQAQGWCACALCYAGRLLSNTSDHLCGTRVFCNNSYACEVSHSLIGSEDFGLPQQRTRLYIVGILRSEKIADFKWPEGIRQVKLCGLLDPPSETDDTSRLPHQWWQLREQQLYVLFLHHLQSQRLRQY